MFPITILFYMTLCAHIFKTCTIFQINIVSVTGVCILLLELNDAQNKDVLFLFQLHDIKLYLESILLFYFKTPFYTFYLTNFNVYNIYLCPPL